MEYVCKTYPVARQQLANLLLVEAPIAALENRDHLLLYLLLLSAQVMQAMVGCDCFDIWH